MQRVLSLAVLLVTMLFAGAAAAGVALAAQGPFDLSALVEASTQAGLLPPITIEGRKGWACEAERHAMATTISDAALPSGH